MTTHTIRTANGHVWTADSLVAAVLKAGYHYNIDKIGYGYLRYYSKEWNYTFGGGDDFVIYDELGLKVKPWKVKETYYNLPHEVREPNYYYWRWRKTHAKPEHYRKYPVPHTGVSHWRRGDRRIRTLQQMRAEEALDLDEDAIEYNVKPRQKFIPNDRDDHIVYVPRTKNWKKFRRNQWKA